MIRRILIVDDVAARRIVLKVKLGAAAYQIASAATLREARRHIARSSPHLVIVSSAVGGGCGVDWVRRIKAHPSAAELPVLVLVPDAAARLDALRAGADDVIEEPFDERLLLARIRAVMRSRETGEELRLRGATKRVLGLAEGPAGFLARGRITLVTPPGKGAGALKAELESATGDSVSVASPNRALSRSPRGGSPDVYALVADPPVVGLGLIPQLRAHPSSRDAAILALVPRGDTDAAVMALDFGAGDVAEIGAAPEELALRVRALRHWKDGRDRLRRGVRDGLQAALTDPLTGLYNRRYAMPHLDRVAERAAVHRRRYAVLVCDLDRFKRVNDLHGHAAGDAVLVEVARRLTGNLRGADTLARLGGEEFLVIMPDVGLTQATAAAERLCSIVRGTPFDLPSGASLRLTMSIGLAIGGERALPTGARAVEAADRALYDAKEGGRARITVSESAA